MTKPYTVADLRKALEGLPDEAHVWLDTDSGHCYGATDWSYDAIHKEFYLS